MPDYIFYIYSKGGHSYFNFNWPWSDFFDCVRVYLGDVIAFLNQNWWNTFVVPLRYMSILLGFFHFKLFYQLHISFYHLPSSKLQNISPIHWTFGILPPLETMRVTWSKRLFNFEGLWQYVAFSLVKMTSNW